MELLNPETLDTMVWVVAGALPLAYLALDYVHSKPIRRFADGFTELHEVIRKDRELLQWIGELPLTIGPFTYSAKNHYRNRVSQD